MGAPPRRQALLPFLLILLLVFCVFVLVCLPESLDDRCLCTCALMWLSLPRCHVVSVPRCLADSVPWCHLASDALPSLTCASVPHLLLHVWFYDPLRVNLSFLVLLIFPACSFQRSPFCREFVLTFTYGTVDCTYPCMRLGTLNYILFFFRLSPGSPFCVFLQLVK